MQLTLVFELQYLYSNGIEIEESNTHWKKEKKTGSALSLLFTFAKNTLFSVQNELKL